MSREINNSEYRQKVIRDLLTQLHQGKPAEDVKAQFKAAFDGISAQEIAQAENELIAGGLPPEEIRGLCDIHASVFEGSIEEIHRPADPAQIPGHPVQTLKAENEALTRLIEDAIRPRLKEYRENTANGRLQALQKAFEPMMQLHLHYLKKENLLFPYLERHGITAPPKVMWGVDDDIRAVVKEVLRLMSEAGSDAQSIIHLAESAMTKASEMIIKEENILLPMALETLTQEEWEKIAKESGDVGYCLIPVPPVFRPDVPAEEERSIPEDVPSAMVVLPTGQFGPEELSAMLDALPVDITFVDKDDTVKYFSQGSERIFPRTKAIIGRKVINCHPPASMHIVEKILADFKAGKKNHEDFWLSVGEKFILIRYYAVHSQQGEYLGTLEVTQDIGPIRKITGEKRLVSDT
jgi:DUF438 domain-containing protein